MIEYRLNEEGFLVEVDNSKNNLEQKDTQKGEVEKVAKVTDEMGNDAVGLTEELDSVETGKNFEGEITYSENVSEVPAKRGFWTKFKDALFKDVHILPRIELTPYENKVFKEVYDFWTMDMRKLFK